LAHGGTVHHRELIEKVQSEFYVHLSDELLDLKTKSGDPLLSNPIAWGKSYLKKAHDAHHTIILVDGVKLAGLMHAHNVGVQIRDTYKVKEIDEDFFYAD